MAELTYSPSFRRDRLIAAAAFLLLASLTWRYLLRLVAGITIDDLAPSTTDIGMMLMPGLRPWSNHEAVVALAMWVVMLTGLLARTAELIPRIREHAGFVTGMMGAWIGLALAAALLQAGIEHLITLTPVTAQVNMPLGVVVLIAAGIYQFLERPRPPLAPRAVGFVPGARHGLIAAGAYTPLLTIAFMCGLMNLTWLGIVAGVAVFEKALAGAKLVSRVIGITLILAGLGLLVLHFMMP
jgi:predicted metal-binding membrane protein